MLKYALVPTGQNHQNFQEIQHENALPAYEGIGCQHTYRLARLQINVAWATIDNVLLTPVPIFMLERYRPEAIFTFGGEHFSGTYQVLSRLNSPIGSLSDINMGELGSAVDIPITEEEWRVVNDEVEKPIVPLIYLESDFERTASQLTVGPQNCFCWYSTQAPLLHGRYIFVWGLDQKIYASAEGSSQHIRKWRHSSFFAGGPVLCAGEFEVHGNGRIVSMINSSGHYYPGLEPWMAFLSFLCSQGIDITLIEKRFKTKIGKHIKILTWLQVNGCDTGATEVSQELRTWRRNNL